MRNIRISFFLSLCFFMFLKGMSQIEYQRNVEKRLTPSPVVSYLGNFGGLEEKKFSGSISKTIPLFQLKQGKLNYNASLDYNSSGIKVDDWGGRSGMGWNEQLIAVIYRTVRSVPDENATSRPELSISQISNISSPTTFQYVRDVGFSNSVGGGVDSEYDIFSYSIFGISGSFYIKNGIVVILKYKENIRIEVIGTNPYRFKYTDNDGHQYYFGTNSNIEYTKFDPVSLCIDLGSSYPEIPTAWFLTNITSANGDTLNFNYASATYKYIYDYNESYILKRRYEPGDFHPCPGSGGGYSNYTHTYCTKSKWTTTKYLVSITGKSSKTFFEYSNRKDLIGDKMLTKINIYDSYNTKVKQISLLYDEIAPNINSQVETKLNVSLNEANALKTRYFLKELIYSGGDNLNSYRYQFSYINANQLPNRFSFSKDYLGYYNGKPNLGLIPSIEINKYINDHPESHLGEFNYLELGDRSVSEVSKYGLLKEIVYPTGGKDQIEYELNSYSTNVTSQNLITVSDFLYTSGSNNYLSTTSSSFVLSSNQIVPIYIETDYLSSAGGTAPDEDDESATSQYFVEVELWDITNSSRISLPVNEFNSSPSILINYRGVYNQSVSLNSGVTYQLRFKINGINSVAYYQITTAGASTTTQVEKPFFGNRVKTVTTVSGSNSPIVKSFSYKSFQLQENRLLFSDQTSSLLSSRDNEGYCNISVRRDIAECDFMGIVYKSTMYHCFNSDSRYNINIYNGYPIVYTHITEFLNLEKTSFISSEYLINADTEPSIVVGDLIPSIPINDMNWENGLEVKRYVGEVSNGVNLVKKKYTWEYAHEENSITILNNYIIHENYLPTGSGEEYFQTYLPYTVLRYFMISKWYRLISQTVEEYAKIDNGYSIIKNSSILTYNGNDKLVSKEEQTTSSNQLLVHQYNRPSYMVALGQDPSGVYQSMVSKNIMNPVIEHITFKNGMQSNILKNEFSQFSPNVIAPSFKEIKIGNDPYENLITFNEYDLKGNLLLSSTKGNSKTSYIWESDYGYCQAIVRNATPQQIAYTSFETNNYGGWSLNQNAAILINTNAVTGKKSLNGSVSKSLPQGNYLICFWAWGTATVNSAAVTNPALSLGNNKYYRIVLNNVSSVNISGSNIDEVSLCPVESEMTTFANIPLIGMVGESDINGKLTYYEYDDLGRLIIIRDQYKNIIKRYSYNYAGQPEEFTDSPNWVNSASTRCKPCPDNPNYFANIIQIRQTDNNPNSITYQQTRWHDTGPGDCPVSAFTNTSTPVRCRLNNLNQPTGHIEQEQRDLNPCSPTYNSLQWVVVGELNSICLPGTPVRAKVFFENAGSGLVNVVVRFFLDANCTQPIIVNNLSINYSLTGNCLINTGTRVVNSINGTSVTIAESVDLSYPDPFPPPCHLPPAQCPAPICNDVYTLLSGTGYIVVP